MSNIPEISLVIPCYNEEGNLCELIKAIRAAVEPLKISYEVVITDDCSKDKSWEILKELAAGDPRIRVQNLRKTAARARQVLPGSRRRVENICSRSTPICRMTRRICRNFWRR
jgi:glycosyltransferase involved in cell wall biosynthesis